CELANFVETIPRDFFALQSLDLLRLCFLRFAHRCSTGPVPSGKMCAQKTKNPRCLDLWHVAYGVTNLVCCYFRYRPQARDDVLRHIQQSQGQQVIWQETFMLS